MAQPPLDPDKVFRHWSNDELTDCANEGEAGALMPLGTNKAIFLSLGSLDVFGDDGALLLEHAAPLWVRVLCLRMTLLSFDIGLFRDQAEAKMATLLKALGIGNTGPVCEHQGHAHLVFLLKHVLKVWEQDLEMVRCTGSHIASERLRLHMKQLSHLAHLEAIDQELLLFFVLADSDLALVEMQRRLGAQSLEMTQLLLSHGLQQPLEAVITALDARGRLASMSLLRADLTVGNAALSCHYDLPSHGFSAAMRRSDAPIERIAAPIAVAASAGSLQRHHFAHMEGDLQWMSQYLREQSADLIGRKNILLYGSPGVGKSELARLLAQTAEKPLVEISASDDSLRPCDRTTRLRGYKLAQALYNENTLFLMDECEDLLQVSSMPGFFEGPSGSVNKAWLVELLESNRPTIWICNRIENFDPALLRRFQFCLQVPKPPERQRHEHVLSKAAGLLNENTIRTLAQHPKLSLAVTDSSIRTVKSLEQHLCVEQRTKLMTSLVNQQLTAASHSELNLERPTGDQFDPSFVNADMDLKALCDGLQAQREGRLLLYGPPGTGKTFFGKFVADGMQCEVHQHKTADFLGKYIGESEERLASAFYEARRVKAILHFDEVDSILMDRRDATRQHEITLVNAFLDELEAHTGVVVATTNRLQSIDPAALRRFDITVKFDVMDVTARLAMFRHVCQTMGLGAPSDSHLSQMAAQDQLTPGDFQQVQRQGRFIPIGEIPDLINRLVKVARSKQPGSSAAIGFLRAA